MEMNSRKVQACSALLMLLLSVMAICPVVSAQSIDDRSTDKGAVFITTSFADPIDQETLKNMRNDAIDTYATKHGEEPMGGADPVVPDGSAIVAYGFFR
jgi:hypothetical protein